MNPNRHERRKQQAIARTQKRAAKRAIKKAKKAKPKFAVPTKQQQPSRVQMQCDLKARLEVVAEEKRLAEKKLAQVNRELAEALKRIQSMQLAHGAMARVAA